MYIYIYTTRTKVFDHHETFHTNSIKLDLFKKGTCTQTVENTFLFQIRNLHILITHKRASLACAARLADTPFGRLKVTLVNYKGDNISKYVHLSVKTDFTRKITKFVNFKIFDA